VYLCIIGGMEELKNGDQKKTKKGEEKT